MIWPQKPTVGLLYTKIVFFGNPQIKVSKLPAAPCFLQVQVEISHLISLTSGRVNPKHKSQCTKTGMCATMPTTHTNVPTCPCTHTCTLKEERKKEYLFLMSVLDVSKPQTPLSQAGTNPEFRHFLSGRRKFKGGRQVSGSLIFWYILTYI